MSREWITNQVVWTRWKNECFPSIIIDPSDEWIGLEEILPDHQHVLWLGDGRVSQIPERDLQDFCLGFRDCHPKMPSGGKHGYYDRAVDLCVRLALVRAEEPRELWPTSEGMVQWAYNGIDKFMELSVSASFYETLQKSHLAKKGMNDGDENSDSDSDSSGEMNDSVAIPHKTRHKKRALKDMRKIIIKAKKSMNKSVKKITLDAVGQPVKKRGPGRPPKLNKWKLKLKPGSVQKPRVFAKKPKRIPRPKRIPVDDIDIEKLVVPLDRGWRREISLRKQPSQKLGDVYYFPLVGKKLRSMNEVMACLSANSAEDWAKGLTGLNFTYNEFVRTKHPNEQVRAAGVVGVTLGKARAKPGRKPNVVADEWTQLFRDSLGEQPITDQSPDQAVDTSSELQPMTDERDEPMSEEQPVAVAAKSKRRSSPKKTRAQSQDDAIVVVVDDESFDSNLQTPAEDGGFLSQISKTTVNSAAQPMDEEQGAGPSSSGQSNQCSMI